MSTNGNPVSPLGLLVSSQVPPEQIPELAQMAEREGFGELWIPEDYFFYGGVAAALTALNATTDIKVGLGVVSAMARHPAALAMEIATIDRLHPGRLWPGIGLGVPHWVEQMGLLPKSPLTALRETVTNVRKLLAGEEVTFEGKIHSFDKVALTHPATAVPPIYMGVIGPKMLNLAGEVADATVVSVLAGTKYLGWLHERVQEGQAKAGRENEHHRVSTFALYAVDADSAKAKAEARAVTAFYLAAVPKSALTDVYGIGDELWDMYQRGGENAAELIAREMPDQWIEDLVVAGDPDEVAEKIQALIDAGSDSVALAPVAADRPAEIVALTASDVLPKVRARTVGA
jgi:alkanesulfonate monooxygenase SsuD/methylene tetrahydromethanopterin reductase-like flavin-dependent oxidoreductase (luciferase family)